MPELPEVEFLKNDISEQLGKNPCFEKFIFYRLDLRAPMPVKKIRSLKGESLTHLERRSKYLIFSTAKGDLISHLGMTGTWRVEKGKLAVKQKHDHVEIWFRHGLRMIYNDPRRFGFLGFAEKASEHPKIKFLGPEPLSVHFTAEYLCDKLAQKNVSIKQALMDPQVVVGVGNIYASEILFASGIHPQKPSRCLGLKPLTRIVQNTQSILYQAIQSGGSSFRNYSHADGKKGEFQNFHCVYARESQKCFVCGTPIRRVVLGGRSTFWCPTCQRF